MIIGVATMFVVIVTVLLIVIVLVIDKYSNERTLKTLVTFKMRFIKETRDQIQNCHRYHDGDYEQPAQYAQTCQF